MSKGKDLRKDETISKSPLLVILLFVSVSKFYNYQEVYISLYYVNLAPKLQTQVVKEKITGPLGSKKDKRKVKRRTHEQIWSDKQKERHKLRLSRLALKVKHLRATPQIIRASKKPFNTHKQVTISK